MSTTDTAGSMTSLGRLLSARLGQDLDTYVVECRNASLGWSMIADRLLTATGIRVSPETLRSWYAPRLETVVRLKASASP